MATCKLERYYAVKVDFIQDGLIFKWSTDNTAVVLKEGQGTAKILVVTDGAVTVNFVLKCVVSSPNGEVKIVERSVTHERVEFNPTVADPFGKNRDAMLIEMNRQYIPTFSGDFDIKAEKKGLPIIPINYNHEWTECLNNKYGATCDTSIGACFYRSGWFLSRGEREFLTGSVLFSALDVNQVARQSIVAVYWPNGSAEFMDKEGGSPFGLDIFLEDGNLYGMLTTHNNSITGVTDDLGSVNDSGPGQHKTLLTAEVLENNKPYSVVIHKEDNDTCYIIVNGTVTNKLHFQKTNSSDIVYMGYGVSNSSVTVETVTIGAKPSGKDYVNFPEANFNGTVANVRMIDHHGNMTLSEAKLISLELNNCQPLTTP